jgi:hypothetical protein
MSLVSRYEPGNGSVKAIAGVAINALASTVTASLYFIIISKGTLKMITTKLLVVLPYI